MERRNGLWLFHSGGRTEVTGERIQRIPSAEVACLHDPLVFGNGDLSLTPNGKIDRRSFPEPESPSWKRRRLRRAQGELECNWRDLAKGLTLSVWGERQLLRTGRPFVVAASSSRRSKENWDEPAIGNLISSPVDSAALRKNQTKHLEVQLNSLVRYSRRETNGLVFDSRAEATCFYTTLARNGKRSAALRAAIQRAGRSRAMETEIEAWREIPGRD